MTGDFSCHENLKRKWMIAGIFATCVIVLILPLSYFLSYQRINELPDQSIKATSTFVGGEKCRSCHRAEYEKWKNSFHDKAMDVANETTVLGDFNEAVLTYDGHITRFFKKEGAFFVNTRGPDGTNRDYRITHTFGVYPLQQYLIPFDGGRLQCLTFAWDDIDKTWYALPNHTDDHTDWLHWTNQGQNWNGMCAECHVTGFKKGYDPQTDRFNTTWTEMDVSCEACHGPGSTHVAWAETPDMGRRHLDNCGLEVKTRELSAAQLVNICARCHSRRASLDDFSHVFENTLEYMIPSLLAPGLYYPDGQILDEVYVYGSFMQSKMFLRGVKCSDCHDVHSQKLKITGNDLCLTCHRADTYDTKDHHFHKKNYKGKESRGDDCIECHMPQSIYMGIDQRADHSIRIPRPDLGAVYQAPNACNTAGCHQDKSLEWTNKAINTWYGQKKRAHFGPVFARARAGYPPAHKDLLFFARDLLSPDIVRATALSLLKNYPSDESYKALELSLVDASALVRQTAIATINLLQFDKDASLIFPLLHDPVRAVRIQAALGIANTKKLKLTSAQEEVLDAAVDEYIRAMEYTSDFPSGRYNLALMYQALGQTEKAIENYGQSIRIDREFVPAINNLAMLYNARGDNEKAENLFKQILEIRPEMHHIAYSLGLLMAEEKKYGQAAVYLGRAAGGLPESARIHYNLGLLLQLQKNEAGAEKALLKALSLEPGNLEFLFALADHYIKRNKLDHALKIVSIMIEVYPEEKVGHDLLRYIHALRETKPRDGTPQAPENDIGEGLEAK